MIEITFVDDGTGTDESANYRYQVAIRHIIVEQGRIGGHDRADGWRALVRKIVAPGMLEACRTSIDVLKRQIEERRTYALSVISILEHAIFEVKGDNANTSDT